jgi:hypothetical protein
MVAQNGATWGALRSRGRVGHMGGTILKGMQRAMGLTSERRGMTPFLRRPCPQWAGNREFVTRVPWTRFYAARTMLSTARGCAHCAGSIRDSARYAPVAIVSIISFDPCREHNATRRASRRADHDIARRIVESAQEARKVQWRDVARSARGRERFGAKVPS